MNVKSLKNFIVENDIEIYWRGEMLLVWVSSYDLLEFADMISSSLDDGGMECNLQRGGMVCIDLVPICSYYGIEPAEIKQKKDNE